MAFSPSGFGGGSMFRGTFFKRSLLVGVAAAITATACGNPPPATADVGSGSLTGAGGTFPAPFYPAAFYASSAQDPPVTANFPPARSPPPPPHFTTKTAHLRPPAPP